MGGEAVGVAWTCEREEVVGEAWGSEMDARLNMVDGDVRRCLSPVPPPPAEVGEAGSCAELVSFSEKLPRRNDLILLPLRSLVGVLSTPAPGYALGGGDRGAIALLDTAAASDSRSPFTRPPSLSPCTPVSVPVAVPAISPLDRSPPPPLVPAALTSLPFRSS